MKKYLKRTFAIAGLTSLLPIVAFAQDSYQSPYISEDSIAYASIFVGNFSILLSIVIGCIATAYVFRAAQKMGGGLFGQVLYHIGTGMVLVVLGTISIVLAPWISASMLRMLHTICFSLGFVFMVLGANKLLRGIMTP
jgi:hypothetical protein